MPRRRGEPADPGDDLGRELQDIAAGRAEQPLFIEPSAAERARRKRVTRMSPPASRKARRRRRRAPAGRGAGRRPARPARAGQALGLLVIAAMLGASLWLLITRNGVRAGAPRLPQGMSVPLAAPAFTTTDPFAGTRADEWADGAAGIVPPRASAIGSFSVIQVRAAYRVTRRLLIAAHLNQRTLAGGPPTAFADLLAPQQRRLFLSRLRRTRTWVTSFAPGTTELVGRVIKVHGAMRALTALDRGRHVLRIHLNYVFVYAVQRPGQPRTRIRVVERAVVNVDFAPWNDPGGPLEAWWQPTGAGGPAGALCDVRDGFTHPDFPGTMAAGPRPVGPESRGACRATTGT
jgi:hypothetical protein